MQDSYLTFSQLSEGEYKEKGSKFLSFAIPVSSVEEAKTHVLEKKKQFFDARHVCYAYRIGFDEEQFRMNDDGEPSGTAGKPIYGQILSSELCDVLIIVVRYFGGTKLGVSGLINAYKEAAKDAIDQNEVVEKIVTKDLKLKFKYDHLNDVMRIVKDENISDFRQDFQLDCKMELPIRLQEYDRIRKRILSIYGIEEQQTK